MSKLWCPLLFLAAAPFLFRPDELNRLVAARLPCSITALDADFSNLEVRLNAELRQAGLAEPEQPLHYGFGYVSEVTLSRPSEYPVALVVRAGVSAGCGNDESGYVYNFAQARSRLLQPHGTGKWGNGIWDTQFSGPDATGSRVFYASWYTFSVDRVGTNSTVGSFALARARIRPRSYSPRLTALIPTRKPMWSLVSASCY